MARRGKWLKWAGSGIAAALVGTAGCDKGAPSVAPGTSTEAKPPVLSVNNDNGSPTAPKIENPKNTTEQPMAGPKLDQPFDEACTFEVPADSGVALPPALTFTGKNCGNLNEQVQKIWNTIRFKLDDGSLQTYAIELEVTDGKQEFGTIEILMQPDLAPNHVRNFVALTMLKFYDGLRFDRIVRQEGMTDDGKPSKLVLLEAGSPVENGDPAMSHLGYWVKPEFNPDFKHEEGTVGACLMESEDNAETAACRFYINLTPAPAMDGNFTAFGKISKGLEIARKLAEQPVKETEPGPDQGRPVMPLVIRKATVRAVPIVR